MEAYSGLNTLYDDDGSDDQPAGHRRVHAVNALSTVEDARVKRLEETVAIQSHDLKKLRVKTENTVTSVGFPGIDVYQPVVGVHPSWIQPTNIPNQLNDQQYSHPQPLYSYSSQPPIASTGDQQLSTRGRGMRVARDTCRQCLVPGHWQRECPQRVNTQSSLPIGAGRGTVGGVSGLGPHSETYMDVNIGGCIVPCQIDSGCDYSVIPRRLIPNVVLKPTAIELTAANSTPISVLGMYCLHFVVQNMQLHADVLVSDTIDEFLLGYNWLKQWNCQWDFHKSLLSINKLVDVYMYDILSLYRWICRLMSR